MVDGVVQVPPDSSGKKIDTSELTRSDGTTVVERQRVSIGDPIDVNSLGTVDTSGNQNVLEQYAQQHLMELRRIARILEIMAGVDVSIGDIEE